MSRGRRLRGPACRQRSAGRSCVPLSRRGRLRRRLIALAGTLVVLFTLFGATTAVVLVWPPAGVPNKVDAIVLLAGPGARMPTALRLAQERRARVLVVSQGQHGYGGPCPPPPPGVRVICFEPDPGDTRGEAEFVGELAKRHGWRSVVLVASAEQDVRARLVTGRCYAGAVYVITAPMPLREVPYEITYGWGALFKALFVVRKC